MSGGQSQQQGSPLQNLQPAQRPPAQPQPQPAAQLPRLAGLADGAVSSAAAAAAAVAAAAGPQQLARQSAAVGAQAAATASTQYLVGLWDSIRVESSVWGFGFKMGVLQYQVKGATGRLLQWQCSSKPGWVPGFFFFFFCGLIVTWTDLMNASSPKKVRAEDCGNLTNRIQLQAPRPYSTTTIGRQTEPTDRVRLWPTKSGSLVV